MAATKKGLGSWVGTVVASDPLISYAWESPKSRVVLKRAESSKEVQSAVGQYSVTVTSS